MEQWASGYGIQENQLIQTTPYILEGAAIDWWNTTPTKINTWKQLTTKLLEYFLPLRYEEQLRTQIAQLKQWDSEPVREYAMGLRKLMRFTKLSEEEKLDRIFNNCRSKIKLYTRRSGFRSLTEFLKLAEEVEEIEAADQTRHNQPAQQQIRPEICMRCGGTGHAARTCGNPQRLFCCVCGRNDIRTTECCRMGPGNAGGLSR
nr:activity-regulated cytoskeleton associated protein 1-like [Drosophila kikkawai]